MAPRSVCVCMYIDLVDMRARVLQFSSSIVPSRLHGKHFDTVVIGGGHNGLVAVSVLDLL